VEPSGVTDLSVPHVLIVDDNARNPSILEEMLWKWEVKTTSAPDGHTALRLMESAAKAGRYYSLVLLDANMPDMDGFSAASLMKGRSSIFRHVLS
jgi:CheY-like chemotaxis protein